MSLYKQNYDKIIWRKTEGSRFALRSSSRVPGAYVQSDYAAYECPVSGDIIHGKREHERNLEKHGCRVHERGELEDVKRNGRRQRDEAIDRAVDSAVEAMAHEIDW